MELVHHRHCPPALPGFLADNLSQILALQIDFEPNRLARIRFEARDLQGLESYPAIARLLADHGLYQITVANLNFILCGLLGSSAQDVQTNHYSTVLRSAYAPLVDKVQNDFGRYLENILLQPTNTEEDVPSIVDVINRDQIAVEYLEQFLKQQTAKLSTLERVPLRLRSSVFRFAQDRSVMGKLPGLYFR